MDLMQEHQRDRGTIFGPFALYVDHAHFSTLGNGLAAERLYQALRQRGAI